MAKGLTNDTWNIPFKRVFGEEESIQWDSLKERLPEMELDHNIDDRVVWCLEKSGMFSVKSLYKQLVFGGIVCRKLKKLWKCKIPLKVIFFLWQCYDDKVQTLEQLKKRG